MPVLQGIPGVLVEGKLDVSGPAGVAWELHKAWPGSRFVLVDDEGHGGPKMSQAMMAALVEHTETD
jgi:proline iminopeptidase